MNTSRFSSYRAMARHQMLRALMAWAYKMNPLLSAIILLAGFLCVFVAIMQLFSAVQALASSGWPHLPDLAQMAFKGVVYLLGFVMGTAFIIKLSTWVGNATETLDRSKHEIFFKLLKEHGYRAAQSRRVHHWEWALVTATLAPEALSAYRSDCLNHALPVASPLSCPKERF